MYVLVVYVICSCPFSLRVMLSDSGTDQIEKDTMVRKYWGVSCRHVVFHFALGTPFEIKENDGRLLSCVQLY